MSGITNRQCVIWVGSDVPDPMLTMQTPLLLHYSFHQAQALRRLMSTFDYMCICENGCVSVRFGV